MRLNMTLFLCLLLSPLLNAIEWYEITLEDLPKTRELLRSQTVSEVVHDGGWTAWTAWTECSPAIACGSTIGTKQKSRQCQSEIPNRCAGKSIKSENCWNGPCPIDGGWSDWSPWSGCELLYVENNHVDSNGQEATTAAYVDVDVDPNLIQVLPPQQSLYVPPCEQQKYRLRECTNPAPQFGGKDCPEAGRNQTDRCSEYPCPIDGYWSEWTEWTQCPEIDCQVEANPEMSTRTRECDNPQPVYGGLDCLEVPADETEKARECEIPFCPVNGGWSAWTEWQCSVTCGSGIKSRQRTCSNPVPAHGGQDCSGELTQTDDCSLSECPPESEWTKLMVIGGSNQEAQANVEVVDLSGEGQTCSRPADAPVQRAATGAYLNGGPTICGGKSDNLIHDQCYRYDSQTDTWTTFVTLSQTRFYHASCRLSSEEMWLSGGYTGGSNGATSSSDWITYTDPDFEKEEVTLPESFSGHATVPLNGSTCLVVGVGTSSKSAFLFNKGGQTFDSLPDMAFSRDNLAAGLVQRADGTRKLVVAGGRMPSTTTYYTSTEILNLDTLEWSAGPALPEALGFATAVQYRNTFLIVGGSGSTILDTIYEYDAENDDWVSRPETLAVPRDNCAAFMMPDDAVDCH